MGGSRLPCNLPFPWDFGYESDLKFLSVIISFLFHIINFGTRVEGAVSGFIAEFTGFSVKYCVSSVDDYPSNPIYYINRQ